MVQTGESVDQAKVFKAHAVPQGLCGNPINALKLLADGLIQSIVTNLCEVSRQGLTEGLRKFMQVDNHRALEVGHLREGLGPLRYEKTERTRSAPRGTCQEKPRRINA